MWNNILQGAQRAYGQFDKNVAAGYLPGGAERQKNLTELALSGAVSNPVVAIPRQALNVAGQVSPRLGPIADASENAFRGVTGDKRSRTPDSYTPSTREMLADAIDRSYADSGANPGQMVDVQYADYSKTGDPNEKNLGAYTAGAFNGGKNADGSYFIDPKENYNFNAQGQDKDYKKNLDKATGDAFKRGDAAGFIANLPDQLAYLTGAGGKGFNIGGEFTRGDAAPEIPTEPRMAGEADITVESTAKPTPSMNYAVQAGDTLTHIARKRGMSVADIAKLNGISDVNQIGIGQNLRFI